MGRWVGWVFAHLIFLKKQKIIEPFFWPPVKMIFLVLAHPKSCNYHRLWLWTKNEQLRSSVYFLLLAKRLPTILNYNLAVPQPNRLRSFHNCCVESIILHYPTETNLLCQIQRKVFQSHCLNCSWKRFQQILQNFFLEVCSLNTNFRFIKDISTKTKLGQAQSRPRFYFEVL